MYFVLHLMLQPNLIYVCASGGHIESDISNIDILLISIPYRRILKKEQKYNKDITKKHTKNLIPRGVGGMKISQSHKKREVR